MSNIGFSGVSHIGPQIANAVISNIIRVGNNETINGDLIITKVLNGSSTGTLSTGNTTFNLINTNATTVNFAGAATTLNVGAIGGLINLNGAATFITKYGIKSVVNNESVYIIPSDDPNGIVASTATPANGLVFTLIVAGTAADVGGTNSPVKLGPSRFVSVGHNSTENGDFVDFVGTDQNGDPQTETLTLSGGTTTNNTANHWSSITSATFRTAEGSGAAANAIVIGWVSTTVSGFYTVGFRDSGALIIDAVGSNVVHSTILQSSTAADFKEWKVRFLQSILNTGSNDLWITTASDDKIFGLTATAVAAGTSNYTPVTNPATGAFVYDAAANGMRMDTDVGANRLGFGAWIEVRAAYNYTATNNTVFFVQGYSPGNGGNNSGANTFV